jgi:hypothetical protein
MGRRTRLHLRRWWCALSRLQQGGTAANAAGLQGRCRQERLAALSWSRAFDDPIVLPNGRQLVTLQDAANYIMKLSKADQADAN